MSKKLKKEKSLLDAVTVFKETAKGTGKLKYKPHEAYEEELKERLK